MSAALNEPELRHIICPHAFGAHRMAYWQWGAANSPHLVLCVHGLSRQGRDFDVLAQALCSAAAALPGGVRVVCPDVVGRGESDWLSNAAGYQIPVYAADMLALLAQLHQHAPIQTLDWVGTSMGGLIGMVVGGQPGLALPAPLRKLVLNDVGPAIEWPAIVRIASYLGQAGHFSSLQAAADAMRVVSAGFGPHTHDEWLALSRHMVKPVAGIGQLRLHYDPAIAQVFKSATPESTQQGEAMLWALYDNITAQTLLLRGADSDLLSSATAARMQQRGPRARLVTFSSVGHAPTLVAKDQLAAVTGFLLD